MTTEPIRIRLGIAPSELDIEAPAVQDSLPLLRQALRSLGETIDAERAALEDAELALTEACANAVEHAYDDDDGSLQVRFVPGPDDIEVSVRDFGSGFDADVAIAEDRGFGLPMIEAIAERFEIKGGDGTEVSMTFGLGAQAPTTVDGAATPGLEPAERILRRLVAVVAGQIDLPSDRLMESLLVAELIARHAVRRVVGGHLDISLGHDEHSFELCVGPLESGGGQALIDDTDVPVIGPVLERLADEIDITTSTEQGIDVEFVRVVIVAH